MPARRRKETIVASFLSSVFPSLSFSRASRFPSIPESVIACSPHLVDRDQHGGPGADPGDGQQGLARGDVNHRFVLLPFSLMAFVFLEAVSSAFRESSGWLFERACDAIRRALRRRKEEGSREGPSAFCERSGSPRARDASGSRVESETNGRRQTRAELRKKKRTEKFTKRK